MMIENIFVAIIIFLLLHYSLFLAKIYYGLKNLSNVEEAKILDEYISIIVPFRNEAANIERTYKNLINQNYPSDKYEIIFVNDSSEDDSLKILESLSTKENVKIFSVPEDFSTYAHKKRAVRFGIEKSKGEIIVTTDADCIHKSDWLINLLKYFDEQTGFVSGPVEFLSQENLFVKIQRLEFAGLVITGAGLIGASNPIICNAANIAYRKIVFNEVGGFNYQMSLSSGDDELLMQKINCDTSYKIKFAADKNAMVSTEANQSIKQFFNQRKRWASKGLFYNDKFLIIRLVLIYLFYLSLFIQPLLALFISKIFLYTFVISFFVKILLEYLILKFGIKLLFNSEILKPFIISELFQIPYIIVSAIAGIFGNFEWKGRLIKR
jgi:cellulose synthase/poly-beta-1,6-N-acetylglucosamine synthase-like glycosyltransferase